VATGSPALIAQLAANLLHNAIAHNLPQGGTAWVTTAVAAGAARLTVENTGAPISAAAVATLTEPFQRGADRVRGDHAGVGLGLAIAAAIVRAHDGRLGLEAREEGGLRVTVDLPATEPPA
jgi:two-component system sensor histidine kinase VanS